MLRVMMPGAAPVAPPQEDEAAALPVEGSPEEEAGESPEEEAAETGDDGDEAGPARKVSQEVVVYMGGDLGPFKCSHCSYFSAPNACSVVDGTIDPEGCCNLYEPPDHEGGPEGQQADEAETPNSPPEETEPEEGSEMMA